MAANLIARYIWEVNALAKARHGLSLEELNEQWRDSYLYDDKDIVRKTWWEHRNQIGVQFGIDIEFDKQTKRYFIKSRNEINRPAIQEWLLDSLLLVICSCKARTCAVVFSVSIFPLDMNI